MIEYIIKQYDLYNWSQLINEKDYDFCHEKARMFFNV